MNILFVVPYPPSLIRVRSYNLIRFLSARGNQVTVLTLYANEKERQDVEVLKQYCHAVEAYPMPRWRSMWNCLRALPSRISLQAVYSWQPALANRMRAMFQPGHSTQPFDVIHVEHLRGARYGLALKSILRSSSTQIPIFWDSVDCISYLFKQASQRSQSFFGKWITRIELARTRWYEGWLVSQFDHVLITSRVDKQALLNLVDKDQANATNISLLPNGADLDYFKPDPNLSRRPSRLIFSGKMSYHANITMVQYLVHEIMPLVWAEQPEIELYIVGKDPSPAIQTLAQNPAIVVTGTVDDLRPYLQQSTAAVVPLVYGAGSQLKLLEAMACGTPVIASPPAISALDVCPGQDLLIAKEPKDFAGAILRLLQDPQLQQQVGQAGRMYVERHHHWASIAKQLEELYMHALEKKTGVIL
jgi:sugar transferase (PEP-CTERM/EpsH1 system associated)